MNVLPWGTNVLPWGTVQLGWMSCLTSATLLFGKVGSYS